MTQFENLSFDSLVYSRRSIRKYKSEKVPGYYIEKMIGSALNSPSPSNSQPVRFYRILSEEKKNEISKRMKDGFDDLMSRADDSGNKRVKNVIKYYFRFSHFMLDAPLLFAAGIVSNPKSFFSRLKKAGLCSWEGKESEDMNITTGLALSSFILKGHELGVGTCVLTTPFYFMPNVEEILGLVNIKINCFISAGFPDEKPSPPARKTIDEVYGE
ncbi:nitroreductase family protein, partial [Desulfobacterales bacterium HSG16]|nr:nitroreductase family protein [Desulfobacterales bacterium HSG16]